MKILITGAAGFLGKEISASLYDHEIISLGRSASTIISDITESIPDLPQVNLVIHAAGKAHSVPRTALEINSFFEVNVKGTSNLLSALRSSGAIPEAFVFISSVSVYGKESGNLINEESPLIASDPYGQSKIQAEQLVQQWCIDNGVRCTILRLPLIAGPNPPGNLKYMVEGIRKGFYLNIGKGNARKSIILVNDVAAIILKAEIIGGVYNLTDGYHPSFAELAHLISSQLDKNEPPTIPMWLAKVMARVGDLFGNKFPINSARLQKITSDLTFDDSKARNFLGWNPTQVLDGFKIK